MSKDRTAKCSQKQIPRHIGPHFARACAIHMRGNIHKSNSIWKFTGGNPQPKTAAHIFRTCTSTCNQSRFAWHSTRKTAPAPRCHSNSTTSNCEKKSFEASFRNGSGRCENDAFVRGITQKVKLASVKKKGLGQGYQRQPAQRLLCATCVAL